jgi:hypothetical protein
MWLRVSFFLGEVALLNVGDDLLLVGVHICTHDRLPPRDVIGMGEKKVDQSLSPLDDGCVSAALNEAFVWAVPALVRERGRVGQRGS